MNYFCFSQFWNHVKANDSKCIMNIIKMILVFWNHVKANDSKCAKSYWRATVQFWNHVKAKDSKWSKADYMVCQNKNLSNRSI